MVANAFVVLLVDFLELISFCCLLLSFFPSFSSFLLILRKEGKIMTIYENHDAEYKREHISSVKKLLLWRIQMEEHCILAFVMTGLSAG